MHAERYVNLLLMTKNAMTHDLYNRGFSAMAVSGFVFGVYHTTTMVPASLNRFSQLLLVPAQTSRAMQKLSHFLKS